MICKSCMRECPEDAHYCVWCGEKLSSRDDVEAGSMSMSSETQTDEHHMASDKRRVAVVATCVVLVFMIGIAMMAVRGLRPVPEGPIIPASDGVDSQAKTKEDHPTFKTTEEAFVGSWNFFGRDTNYTSEDLEKILIREDGTAAIWALKMGSPNRDGSQPVLGLGDRQEYAWKTDGTDAITLKPREGATVFGGGDLTIRRLFDYDSSAWNEAIVVNDGYYAGANDTGRRAGWNKRIDTGEFDVFQVQDMDVLVGDDSRHAVKVVASGYDEYGYAGYLLEVTNKTDEEANVSMDYDSYNNWTIDGRGAGNPDFRNRYVDAAKDGVPSVEYVFMYFSPTIQSPGSEPRKGYDGDLDGLRDVKGMLEIGGLGSNGSSFEFSV